MKFDLHREVTRASKLKRDKENIADIASILGIKISPDGPSKIVSALESWKENSASKTRLPRTAFLKQQDLTSAEKEIINEILTIGGLLILI